MLQRLPFGPERRQARVASEAKGERTWRRYERHERLIQGFSIALGLACAILVVLAVLTLDARAHYERGRRDLAAGRYERAAAEFDYAFVVMVPYRDAIQLRLVAERAASEVESIALLSPSLESRAYGSALGRTLRALRDRRYLAAAVSLRQLRRDYPDYAISLGRHGPRAAVRAADALFALAGQAFHDRRWRAVGPYASAALVFQHSWSPAVELQQRAALYASVAPSFQRAQSLVSGRAWARAAGVLRRLIAKAPDYPGAAGLLATAKARLAERRKARSQASTPAVSPSPAPSPPPKPSPKPTPTLPPPP